MRSSMPIGRDRMFVSALVDLHPNLNTLLDVADKILQRRPRIQIFIASIVWNKRMIFL